MPTFFRKNKTEYQESYSQCGEDLVVYFVLKNHLKVDAPSYLDVGANEPRKYNNTYLFYTMGSRGVLVEPDPDLARALSEARPHDKILNVGISDRAGERTFYLMDPHTLNTFSKRESELYQKFYSGVSLRGARKTKVITINKLIEDYFPLGLDFLSIDIEGLDKVVIESLDFKRHRPSVICIESMIYGEDNRLTKSQEIAEQLYKNNYFKYADTFVNTIFVDKKKWLSLGQPNLVNMEGF